MRAGLLVLLTLVAQAAPAGWDALPTALKLKGIPCKLSVSPWINLMPTTLREGQKPARPTVLVSASVRCGEQALEIDSLEARYGGRTWSGKPDGKTHGGSRFVTDFEYRKGQPLDAAATFTYEGQTYRLRLAAPTAVTEAH